MKDLRRLRRLAGWTQHQLASRSKVGRDRISLVETGQLELSPEEEATVRQLLLRAIADRAREAEEVLAGAPVPEPTAESQRALTCAGPDG